MRKLTVGFSYRSRSLLSWIIRRLSRSKVSHTYLRLPTPYEMDMIFQASGLAVNYCNQKTFEEHAIIAEEYDVEISDEQYAEAEKLRVTEAGKSYSTKQLIGFAWVLGMRQFGQRVSNPLSNGDHSYICVEIVARCLGLKDVESMTPEDLRLWCKKNSKRVR